jgi:hypothetical protein
MTILTAMALVAMLATVACLVFGVAAMVRRVLFQALAFILILMALVG